MANIHQRKSLWRKLIYTVAIVILFTVSIVYRKQLLEPSGSALSVLASSRHGEVERRGPCCKKILLLWPGHRRHRAVEHRHREAEEARVQRGPGFLVGPTTKLQPYFPTP